MDDINPTNDNISTPSLREHRRVVAIVLAAVLFLTVIVGTPFAIRLAVLDWLANQGQSDATLTDVDFNLFTGRLSLKGLHAGKGEGHRLDAEEVIVRINWLPFVLKRISVERIFLKNAHLDGRLVESDAGSVWEFGGISVRGDSANDDGASELEKPWGVGLGALDVDSFVFKIKSGDFLVDGSLDKLMAGSVSTWQPEQGTPVDLALTLHGGVISLKAEVTPLKISPQFGGDLVVSKLPLGWLNPLLIPPEATADGESAEAAPEIYDWSLFQRSAGLADLAEIWLEPLRRGLDKLTAVAGYADAQGHLAATIGMSPGTKTNVTWKGRFGISEADFSFAKGKALARELINEGDLTCNITSEPSLVTLNTSGSFVTKVVVIQSAQGELNIGSTQLEGAAAIAGGPEPGRLKSDTDFTLLIKDATATAEDGEASVAKVELMHKVSAAITPEANETQLAGSVDEGVIVSSGVATGGVAMVIENFAGQASEDVVKLDSLTVKMGDLAASGDTTGSILANSTNNISLNGLSLHLAEQALGVTLDNLSWEATAGFVKEVRENSAPLIVPTMEGSANLAMLKVTHQEAEPLVGFERLTLQGLSVDGMEKIGFEALEVAEGHAYAKKVGDKVESAIRFDRLNIEKLAHTPALNSIGSILVENLEAAMVKSREGGWMWERSLEGMQGQKELSSTEGGDPANFKLGMLSVTGDSSVAVLDDSVKPATKITASPFSLVVKNIDTSERLTKALLTLNAGVGEYGKVDLKFEVSNLAGKPTGSGTLTVKEFDLTSVNGYSRRAIGQSFKTGQLNLTTEGAVEEGIFDALLKIKVYKLDLEGASASVKEAEEEINKELGMPVAIVVSLLADDDDNILLDVPLTGDFKDPGIGFGSVIGIAVKKGVAYAVKDAAISFFAPLLGIASGPLGLVVMAGGAGLDFVNALRFKPVEFQPGSTSLDDAAKAHLLVVAEKLQQRPKLHMTICSAATELDRIALTPPPVAKPSAATPTTVAPTAPPTPPPTKDKKLTAGEQQPKEPQPITDEELLEIGKKRMREVKRYLTEEGVLSKNLLECTPEIAEAAEAKPIVELDF